MIAKASCGETASRRSQRHERKQLVGRKSINVCAAINLGNQGIRGFLADLFRRFAALTQRRAAENSAFCGDDNSRPLARPSIVVLDVPAGRMTCETKSLTGQYHLGPQS